LPKLYFKIQDCCAQLYAGGQVKTKSPAKPPLKIRQVAAKLEIAAETIRMYEREGLLLPARSATGQRQFDESDVRWIACIRSLIKEKRLNLEGIRRLLALMPCWELRPCSEDERKNCPAYWGATQPCWMIKAILQGECHAAVCRDCSVYQSASHCDNLKTLLRKQTERRAEGMGYET
jgi:MerR family transcriptional regulator/heat shock protein HspR